MTRLVVFLLIATFTLAGPSLRQMFERARLLEEKNQNLEEAIQLYGQVASQAKEQRALGVRAQLQVGLLYERLGRKTEALRAWHVVLADYPDQDEAVRQARVRIQAATGGPAGSMTVRQRWSGPGADYFGAISPDGSLLTYVDWDTGDLAVRNLATGEKRRLTNKGAWSRSEEFAEYSRISPDGRQVAYAWYDGGTRFELRLMGFNGAKGRVLYRNEKVYHPRLSDWTPDGKHILAVLHYNQLVMISVADGSVRALKTLERSPDHAMLSRDGRYVVYDHPQEPDAAERDIFLFSLAAPQEREPRLVEHPANDVVLGWTPDGKGLLFASERTGSTDIWLLPIGEGRAQGPATLARKDVGPITPIGFTRKGSFYYGVDTTLRDIHAAVIDPDTGKLVEEPKPVLQRHLGRNKYPAWPADGKHMAYLSERQGGELQNTGLAAPLMLGARLHPDGRRIAFVAGEKQSEVWLMENFLLAQSAGR